jgi:hypothetical protein
MRGSERDPGSRDRIICIGMKKMERQKRPKVEARE